MDHVSSSWQSYLVCSLNFSRYFLIWGSISLSTKGVFGSRCKRMFLMHQDEFAIIRRFFDYVCWSSLMLIIVGNYIKRLIYTSFFNFFFVGKLYWISIKCGHYISRIPNNFSDFFFLNLSQKLKSNATIFHWRTQLEFSNCGTCINSNFCLKPKRF